MSVGDLNAMLNETPQLDDLNAKIAAGLAIIAELDRKLSDDESVASSDRAFITDQLAPRRPPTEDDLPAYASAADLSRLAQIDDELRARGHDIAVVDLPTDDDALRQMRLDRAQRKHELDIDVRLALARDAPLVILDDDEVQAFEQRPAQKLHAFLPPPCAADIRALVAKLKVELDVPEDPARVRAQVDALAASMKDQITTIATMRDERRRRRRGDHHSPPPMRTAAAAAKKRPPPTTYVGNHDAQLAELSEALRAASLKANFALQRAESSTARLATD